MAALGAKKIYGLDISEEMISTARTQLTQKGLIDKFELICADIYDDNLTLPEKVDVVLLVNTVSTFISSYEMLQ